MVEDATLSGIADARITPMLDMSGREPPRKMEMDAEGLALRDGMPGGACRTVTFLDDGKTMNCGLGASILAAEKPNIR